MKNIKISLFSLATSILILASCSSTNVISDYDRNVDFGSYKSFMFLPWNKKNSSLLNDFDKARLYAAVEQEMTKRGYVRKEYGADMAVNLMVILDKQTAINAYTTYYNNYGYYSPFGFGHSATQYNKYDYLVGTLVIDIFEVKNKKLIWQGVAIKEIDENPSNKETRINHLMGKVFYKYPLKPIAK